MGDIGNTAGPDLVILAGPNGAGKTTAVSHLLPDTLGIRTFVNADLIAQELAPDNPEAAAVAAGRQMLAQLEALIERRATFAFETTLSGRSYVPWLRKCKAGGYTIRIIFFWLETADLAIDRVAKRVASGGHHIPEGVIRRRYVAGIRNFVTLYRPLATAWSVYDNSERIPRPIASGIGSFTSDVADRVIWEQILRQAGEHV